MSHDDVIQSADPAEPLAQRLPDPRVGDVAGELAEARVERRLERQEGGVRQEEDLVQESQNHVGPRLQRETGQRSELEHAGGSINLLQHMLQHLSQLQLLWFSSTLL